MKVSTQPYKGARDFYPDDKRLQKWMFAKWARVVERYGYQEYDAPILEPTDIYLMKGSEEIVKEQTYTFRDRGDRSVTVRTEMTPSVSRMVAAKRQELAYPARWYSIPNMWRYERMQRGRLREFWQLNVDVFGVDNNSAEIEMLQIVNDLFRAFKAKPMSYGIKINSRRLVNYIFNEFFRLDEQQSTQLARLVDRKDKMPAKDFLIKVDEIVDSLTLAQEIVDVLEARHETLPADIREHESYVNLLRTLQEATTAGVSNAGIDLSLMRGFDYYTDFVFEVFDADLDNNRSMFGGGRYDGLVGQFGADPVPTVGFGMGDVTFYNFLESNGLMPELRPETQVVVVARNDASSTQLRTVASELRDMGVNVAVDYSERKTDKQSKAAIKSGVRYILYVDDSSRENGQFSLRDTRTDKNSHHSLQRIVSIVLDQRQ